MWYCLARDSHTCTVLYLLNGVIWSGTWAPSPGGQMEAKPLYFGVHCRPTHNLSSRVYRAIALLFFFKSNILTEYHPSGTQSECWSQEVHKYVICLLDICQKTVSYKNVSENCLKYVISLSEKCQILISIRTVSDNIWKCIMIKSDFINVSENCWWFIWKTVWSLSEISLLTHLGHIYRKDELGSAASYTVVLLKYVL